MEDIQSTSQAGVLQLGPVVTKKLFSQLTGLTEETIRGMIDRGHLPTVKIGKHRMVNVALITKEALEAEFERQERPYQRQLVRPPRVRQHPQFVPIR